jgi:pantoate--beta-alanine ligase
MQIIKTINDLTLALSEFRKKNPAGRVGFVPTMGFLHEGHLSLMKKAREQNECVVVSIFVNPLQFNNPDDFTGYPVNIERDSSLCKDEKIDILFLPSKEEMYPETPLISLNMPALVETLCGKYRAGHFEGVMLVVSRLFHLVMPDSAYFGKKDYQQLAIIKRMTKDLAFPLNIFGMPTMRERDGLAMSSRNVRLSAQAREHASLINRGLKLSLQARSKGNLNIEELKEIARDVMESGSMNRVEYVQIVEPNTLMDIEYLEDDTEFVIACAVYTDGVRLIDNMEWPGE